MTNINQVVSISGVELTKSQLLEAYNLQLKDFRTQDTIMILLDIAARAFNENEVDDAFCNKHGIDRSEITDISDAIEEATTVEDIEDMLEMVEERFFDHYHCSFKELVEQAENIALRYIDDNNWQESEYSQIYYIIQLKMEELSERVDE